MCQYCGSCPVLLGPRPCDSWPMTRCYAWCLDVAVAFALAVAWAVASALTFVGALTGALALVVAMTVALALASASGCYNILAETHDGTRSYT